MKNIPVQMGGFKLMVTEAPVVKMTENKKGERVPATDFEGVVQYQVMLFAKRRPNPGDDYAPKGEEIKVTLATDPGEGFDEGVYVELVGATVSSYQLQTEDGRTLAGLSFKAQGLKPAGSGAAQVAA